MYFLANDPRVPEEVRDGDGEVGPGQGRVHRQRQLAAPDLRPRGAADGRRLRDDRARLPGQEGRRPTRSAWARTSMDSHNVQPLRHARRQRAERGRHRRHCPAGRTAVGYGAIVPKKGECANLLVPVCVSSSHIAYGSIRMEPVFMVLGQSAATAASLAIEDGLEVQEVPYAKLGAKLLEDGRCSSTRAAPRERRSAARS